MDRPDKTAQPPGGWPAPARLGTPPPAAIPTRYAGCHFRSRLEARWAVFFDHLGITWEYEPEGYELLSGDRYLPDFWLPQRQMHAEVKGGEESFLAESHRYTNAVWAEVLPGYELMILGSIPDPRHMHWPYALIKHIEEEDRAGSPSGGVLCAHAIEVDRLNEEMPKCRVGYRKCSCIGKSGEPAHHCQGCGAIGYKNHMCFCSRYERPISFETFCTDMQSPVGIGILPLLTRADGGTGRWTEGSTHIDWPPTRRIAAAYIAARSARFEHGQSGPT